MALRTPVRSGGQAPRRPRRAGRLSPTNGSVTRLDIEAIYREFRRGADGLSVEPTVEEFLVYLKGAIIDPSPGPRTRAKLRVAARRREARRQAERTARDRLAQLPVRAAAAA